MAGRPTGTAGGRRRAAIAVAAVLLLIVVAALVAAPPLSRPLTARLAVAWLRAHGADASVEVAALSDTALTARVRLGDRRDPELTIDRLDVTYSLSGPWNGRGLDFTPTAVRLVRPRLKARWRNGTLDLGQLRGLVDWALSRPATGQPLPAVTIVDGQARLATPVGSLLVTGDGAYSDRRTLVFTGGLAPFRLVLPRGSVAGDGGVLEIAGQGSRLVAKARLGATRLEQGPDTARAAALSLQSDLPWPERSDRMTGPASLRLSVQGLSGVWAARRLADGALTVAVDGPLDATTARQRLVGALSAAARAAAAEGTGVRAVNLVAGAELSHVDLVHDGRSLSARGQGALTLALDRVAGVYGAGAGLSAAARLTDGAVALDDGAWSGRATLAGRAAGRGGMAAPIVRRLVGALPVVSGSRRYAGALAAALKDVRVSAPQWRLDVDRRRTRFALPVPARLDTASGAAVTLSGRGALSPGRGWSARGAGVVSVSGGGLPSLSLQMADLAAGPGGVQTTVRGRGAFDIDMARGAEATLDARLGLAKGRLRLDLLQCGPLKASRLAAGGAVAETVALRVCPGAGPLFEASGAHWRAGGRLDGLRGDDAALAVGLRDARATFDAGGGAAGVADARLALEAAGLVDLADPARFRPLAVEGDLRGGEAWRGAFTVSDRAKHRLARLTVTASPTGAGRLDVDTGELTFVPGGLQPVDLTPLAAGAKTVAGQVAFNGWFEWASVGKGRSGGTLAVHDLGLTGPTGPVTGLDSRIVFTSLWPPATAPGQALTVARIDSLTPLTRLDLVFDLNDATLNLRRLQGDLAGGRVSLAPAAIDLRPGARFEGALTLHGVDLGQVLSATSLADQVKLQAIVDGVVPFSIGPSGLTIQGGVLTSVGGGRLSIPRTALGAPSQGPPTQNGPIRDASGAQGGVAQDFAYQALEDLAFDSLEARLGSLPKDRLGVIFHIKGRHDPPKRRRAIIRFADAVRGHALDRPLALPSDTKIDLTLDTSLNFGELVRALAGAWQDAIRPATTQPEGVAPGSASPATGDSRHP